MANLHLSHKLPWGSLSEAFEVDRRPHLRDPKNLNPPNKLMLRRTDLPPHPNTSVEDEHPQWKVIKHFAHVLTAQVAEFRETDSWRDVKEEALENEPPLTNPNDVKALRLRFDLTTWSSFNNHACLPERESVLLGYIQLNLMLLDDKKWRPVFHHGSHNSWFSLAFEQLRGEYDNGHPNWLSETIQGAFEQLPEDGGVDLNRKDYYRTPFTMRPLDVTVAGILREHTKELFRVMYRSPALEEEEIAESIARGFDVWFSEVSDMVE
eukprot:CAMPEP_0198248956 /NCGR_PEP_ID=MMETSP1447-20131203/601_1 /TAXON_ID=420782 /ORGANISM="Chaetoceros dichaeta, Strain CCMP1751" /LENGTH=264 /DNA_ID=CAMNT_0043933473 /DNA_START=39 /DNA_END=833 /DNA_ORIENTATION=+